MTYTFKLGFRLTETSTLLDKSPIKPLVRKHICFLGMMTKNDSYK